METGLIIFALAVSAGYGIYCMNIEAPSYFNPHEKDLYLDGRIGWATAWVAIVWCLVGWAL